MPISCTPLRILITGRALPSRRVSSAELAARIVDVYSQFGNQVAASLPDALHAAFASARLGPGKRALLLGTAAGMSLGGLVLDH